MVRGKSDHSTVVLEKKVKSWGIENEVSLGKLKLIEFSKQVLVKHHVVEIVNHLVKVIKFLEVLSLILQGFSEALVLILIVFDVTALVIECVTVLWKVYHVFLHNPNDLFALLLQFLKSLLLLLVHHDLLLVLGECLTHRVILILLLLREHFMIHGRMQVALSEWLVHLGSQRDLPRLQIRV